MTQLTLLRNERTWSKYLNGIQQTNVAIPLYFKDKPKEYPCLVSNVINIVSGRLVPQFTFCYVHDAKMLLTQAERKAVNNRNKNFLKVIREES